MLNLSYVFDVAKKVYSQSLCLPQGSSLQQALDAIAEQHPDVFPREQRCIGVWGKRCDLDYLLQDGDRIELWRDLLMDPKEARRLRALKRANAGKNS